MVKYAGLTSAGEVALGAICITFTLGFANTGARISAVSEHPGPTTYAKLIPLSMYFAKAMTVLEKTRHPESSSMSSIR